MAKRIHSSTLLFYALIAVMASVSIVTFVSALSWLNKPFAGFLTYQDAFVSVSGTRDWSGPEAGIKFGQRIVAVDDQPVRGGRDLVAMVKKKQVGTPARYLVESDGKTREIIVPVSKFSATDFLLVYVVPLLAGLMLYSLGCTVYVLKPNTSTSWVFLVDCFCMGTMILAGLENQTSYILTPFFWIVNAVWPFTFLHLFLIFPERHRILTRFPKFEYLIYVPVLILITVWEVYLLIYPQVLSGESASWFPTYRELGRINSVFRLFCVVSLLFLILSSILKPFSSQAHQRAKVIFWGVVLALGPPVIVMTLFFFVKVNVPWNLLVFFSVLFPASIAYSIVRHNLFDADAIIKRTVGYVIVTAVVVGVYVLVSISFNVFLGKYQVSQSKAFPIIFTLIIILIFNPLRNRIQSLVDRVFFRKEYDYGEIIHRIGGAMTSLLDLGQILRQLIGTFMKDMFIDTSSVMLLTTTGTGYQIYLADGESKNEVERVFLRREQPLIQIIEREKREMTKYDILEDPKYKAVCEDCVRDFETLHASLMVPLIFQDEVIGLLNLGEKKSGKSYNRDDIDLLHTLANQGAVAIQNGKLVDQMKSEEAVRTNLARYLSPQIADQVIKKNVQVNLGGDRKVVTVLFSDIRNFTRISESLPPDKLVQLLNEYFTEMARIIFENQGSLDKYIGDAIVAVFGSLIPLENSGRNAVQAAIQMMQEMSSLNERWKNQYGFCMDIGIGINTGEVFLGNIGSPERMEFTVIGDAVNIASRFSDLAKAGQILITKETFASLSPDIRHKELPPTEVKGKTGKLEVFEILY
jgi:class 3 adenylate cyclase